MLANSICLLKYISTADPETVAKEKSSLGFLILASLIPVREVSGRSKTRKAAKLAVYDATIIIANPAQTIPKTRPPKDLGVPSPIPEFNNTPQANQIADDKLSASSSVMSEFGSLYLPKGENLSRRYRAKATK